MLGCEEYDGNGSINTLTHRLKGIGKKGSGNKGKRQTLIKRKKVATLPPTSIGIHTVAASTIVL